MGVLNYKISFLSNNMQKYKALTLMEWCLCVGCVCCIHEFSSTSCHSVFRFQLSIDGHQTLLPMFDYQQHFSNRGFLYHFQIRKLLIFITGHRYQNFFLKKEVKKEEHEPHDVSDVRLSMTLTSYYKRQVNISQQRGE